MFEYAPLTRDDLDALCAMYETYLNGGKAIREHLERDFSAGGYRGVKCVTDTGEIIGMASSKPGLDFTLSRPALEAELAKLCAGRHVYTGDMTVVLPEYRKLGISHELARRMIEMLRQMGVELYLTELWIHPNGYIPAEKLYATYGRAIYSRDIPKFYEHMHKYGITCPICGVNCICSARVSLLDISGDNVIATGETE